MIGNSPEEVKSRTVPAFRINDTTDRLSLAYAIEAGYEFSLSADGDCEVSKPSGEAYYVRDFACNCPDKVHRGGSHAGHCRHEIYVAQLFPCSNCATTMVLGVCKNAWGVLRAFFCPSCNNARAEDLVRQERRMRSREVAHVVS